MSTKKYWYVTQADLIDQLSEAELQILNSVCVFKTFQKKDLIFSPSDPAQRIYILKKGSVTLYKLSPRGKKVILEILRPVTLFGDVSFLYDKVQDHYAEASSDVDLCVVPKDAFLSAIERRPELALKLLEITSHRLREAEDRVRDLAISDARSRVTNQLYRLSEILKKNGKEVRIIKTRVTHEMLANMVGLTRETTTKILNDLEREGILTKTKDHRLVIMK